MSYRLLVCDLDGTLLDHPPDLDLLLIDGLQHLNVPLTETIGIGDQENDLEMIEAAGLGIAMPGAPETVRQAAWRVVPPDEQGGLLALFTEILPQYFA
jgi:hydroxymethylpyrimidine pyrophosphatase-like HAD family hydrolase